MAEGSTRRPQEPTSKSRPQRDPLIVAMLRIAEELEQPLSEAELRSSGVPEERTITAFEARSLAERQGFRTALLRASRRRLLELEPPFVVTSAQGENAWIVRAQQGDRVVYHDVARGLSTTAPAKILAPKADMILQVRAPVQAGTPSLWHDVVWRRLKPALWEIGLASVVINILALATPLFMMTVYNKVINHAALQTLDVLMVGMLSLVAFELVLRALRGFVTTFTGARLDAAIGSEVMHHILRLPYRVFEAMPSSQMMERLRQIDQLRVFLTGNLPLLLVDLGFVGLFVAAVFFLAPPLGWITLTSIPVFILVSVLAQGRQTRLIRQNFKDATAKSGVMSEAITQALTVKALGLEPAMERRFETRLAQSAKTGLKSGRTGSVVASLGQALQHIAALVLVYVGARLIVAGELSVGALIAATILSARALAPMRQIAFAWHQFQQAREAFSRLDALFKEMPDGASARRTPHKSIKGALGLHGLCFSYAGQNKPALNDVTLKAEPGTFLGIIGPSGSGKSTLLKLMLGLEVPTAGVVTIDGVDLRTLPPAMVRSQIGFVPQDVQLFAGTIADNIALGSVDRSLRRIAAAARFVGLHDFIETLPQGYDTVLNERGSGLSNGQRQLISIARALIRNPKVLILDEATSALDPESEALLIGNLERASRGRTIILVTHRRSALKHCTHAVAFDQGQIIAQGRPEAVINAPPVRESRARNGAPATEPRSAATS